MPPTDNTNQNTPQAPQSGDGSTGTAQPAAPEETFEGYLAKQAPEIQALYESHTAGLKSALDSERATRTTLEKQLREMAKNQVNGSEIQATLTKQADELAAVQQRAEFFDKAHTAGIRNLSLAYIAATQAGLVDSKGTCDYAKLKALYPELFIAPPPGNAGSGTATAGNNVSSMNQAIRRAAGRS